MYTTLIDATALQANLEKSSWVTVDCRFDLADTAAGRQQYLQSHIPGAVYAHLDEDLSGPPVTDNGRHPLPTPDALAALFAEMGIGSHSQVVVYDAHNGMVASRLWWMLRFMGHETVAVLDGGWQAWQAAEFGTRSGQETNRPAQFTGQARLEWLTLMADIPAQKLLIDSRGGERFRGEIELYDTQAGHIPGAVNYFYQENWGADGRYLPLAEMYAKLETILGNTPVEEAVFYCGSGVSACVNLLALKHVGLGDGRLYVGSWSEWSRHPDNPIAIGN
ncbi:MAG: sulfurtransferase [Chloroflexi bacterium]|nr:sulfurtransferase [Chloroflexota bacterium]